MQIYNLILPDLERGIRMDIADAQSRIVSYTRQLHAPRHKRVGHGAQWRARIKVETATILCARRDIIALRKAQFQCAS
jgi:hypothetical protein